MNKNPLENVGRQGLSDTLSTAALRIATRCRIAPCHRTQPPTTLAADPVVVTDCTQSGLETAITTAAITDPANPGIVTFNCTDNIIEFTSPITIGSGTSIVAVLIDGRNRGGDPIILDGQGTTPLFNVNHDGNLTLQYLTIQNGSTDHDGGAIESTGTLTISQSTFSNNHADRDGGAIFNWGFLTISQSTFSNNHADRDGGAIRSHMAYLIVTSSTLSGNTAGRFGSAINVFAPGTAIISWSTIIQPAGNPEALVASPFASIILTGVILGGEGKHCFLPRGVALTDSYTLSNDTTCRLIGTGSKENITYLDGLTNLSLDAKSTITMHGVEQTYYPLLATGPARDAVPSEVGCDTDFLEGSDPDQLGNPRPMNDLCDIGAIEFGNTPPAIQPASISIPEGISTTLTIAANDLDGDDLQYAIDCNTSDQTFPLLTDSNQVICSAPDDTVLSGLVKVSDGTVTNTHFFTITVTNRIPIMTTPSASLSLASIGQPITIDLSATDVPADTISFTINCGDSSTDITIPPTGPTAPVDATASTFTATTTCTYSQAGLYTITTSATDDDLGTSLSLTTQVEIVISTTVCANRWNGSLTVRDDCTRSQTQITLPQDGPITLCVNNWNGTARASDRCSRSEHQVSVIGNDTIPACINTWNGALRIADHCTRSEHQTLL